MATPPVKLLPVNFYVRLPGYSDGFHCRRLRFDPSRIRLVVQAPEGLLVFNENHDFYIDVLDLSIPLYLRINSPNDGWVSLNISEFLNLLNLDHLLF